ncbi:hypothetical protein QQS21_005982 [Conoideocrella luteorostrata]|uniref:Uncharacterized protein n=1 Tax=Conoideocrella luteorostrata TaxID=1105319 RepID=A0AAJ0FYN9_9HYPO|nr:hypothetical protein QQS21_005982 [Conoideocrella luteorostrata]
MYSQPGFSLAEVLAVAKIHPIYNSHVQYPPDAGTIEIARTQVVGKTADVASLEAQPLLFKKDLYGTIQRLIDDLSPENKFRRSIYTSVTGGGGGSKALFFATDVHENRRQRVEFGRLLNAVGIIKETDCVVTVHTSGGLYRALDLTLELLENAGATALAAGHNLKEEEVIRLARVHHANVLSGDSSQIVQLVHYMSTMKREERDELFINKIIYTSETMTPGQRSYIYSVLGLVQICSFLGSAEAGPYAASSPHLVEGGSQSTNQDFIFDTRQVLIEILPYEAANRTGFLPTPLPQGEKGVIAQTSLCRLRNPVIRYITGDVGSVHNLHECAREHVSDQDWPHLRILRLRGRDARFSFEWDGEYVEFPQITSLMTDAQYCVLQWQVILDKANSAPNSTIEVPVLSSVGKTSAEKIESLEKDVKRLLHVDETNEERFRLLFVEDLSGFIRSETGRKVIRFVDRFNQ